MKAEAMISQRELLEYGAEMRKDMLEAIVGGINTELLREQRNHLLRVIEGEKPNEFYLDGVINMLDNLLDILDLHTGA